MTAKTSGMSRGAGKPRIGYGRKKGAPAKQVEQYNQEVELRTAHDVRKLAGCEYCKGMGDKNHMIPLGTGNARQYIHGRCYAVQNGLDAILALPQEVTDRLTIGDIGGPVMKALLKQRRPS